MADPADSSQSPAAAEAAAVLVALYAGIAATLLAGFTVILAKAVATPFGRAATRRQLTAFARQIAGTVSVQRTVLVDRLLAAEHAGGTAEAERQVVALDRGREAPNPVPPILSPVEPGRRGVPGPGPTGDLSVPHGVRAAAAIRAELVQSLHAAELSILRAPEDVYQAVVAESAIQQVVATGITPEQAQARAWAGFVQRGITGFTDTSGRRWTLASYAEMSVRTAAARAFVEATVEQLHVEGVDLFEVTEHDDPCPLCLPWQHAILSVSFNPWADATIDEARAAGLLHPNCRHTLVGWLPGLSTRLPRAVWTEADQARYAATQQQRSLERQIRRAREVGRYAISDNQRRQAGFRVRELQARLRRLVAEHGNLSRESRREQPTLGFGR